jgi:hypothetical protein
MKKFNQLLLVVFLVSLGLPASAQNEDNKKGGHKVGGIRAGYQSSIYVKGGDQLTGTTPLEKFYIGLYRDSRIIPTLFFGSGLEYYQNGARLNDDNKRVLHYVGVPLYLKVKLGPVFALGGFEPSFKVSEKQFLAGVKSTPSDKANWFDAPFFLGAGLKILFITIDARYHWGTLDVYQGAYSQYLQIGAALSF